MMKQLDLLNKKLVADYETYLEKNNADFLQSTLWGKVKKGWKQEIYVDYDDSNNINGSFAILVRKIKYTPFCFVYCPKGALIDWYNENSTVIFMNCLKDVLKKHHALMFKMEPTILIDDQKTIDKILQLGFKLSQEEIQCKDIYILDIENKTEEDIFQNFTSKCRYNIRYAIKNGLTCNFYGSERIDDFYELLKITGERDHFPVRKKEYFINFLETFGKEHCRLCICDYKDIPLSAALVVNYGGRFSYVYGCSSNNFRNLMPNYLMHWTMIQEAIKNGLKIYDFLGIPHFDQTDSVNYGTFCFKRKFNGQIVQYVPGFDYAGLLPIKICYFLKKIYTRVIYCFTH